MSKLSEEDKRRANPKCLRCRIREENSYNFKEKLKNDEKPMKRERREKLKNDEKPMKRERLFTEWQSPLRDWLRPVTEWQRPMAGTISGVIILYPV